MGQIQTVFEDVPVKILAVWGHVTSAGLAGVQVNMPYFYNKTGSIADSDAYQVFLSYNGTPAGNGNLYYLKDTNSFYIYHYGATNVEVSYLIVPTT